MKLCIVLFALAAIAIAAPADKVKQGESEDGHHNGTHGEQPYDGPSIVSYDNNNDGLGPYNFAFETSDGITREETAEVSPGGKEGAAGEEGEGGSLVVKGSYSYTAPDGQLITVKYIADENGYRVL